MKPIARLTALPAISLLASCGSPGPLPIPVVPTQLHCPVPVLPRTLTDPVEIPSFLRAATR